MTVSPLTPRRAAETFDDFYRQHFPRVLMLVARHFPACDAEEIAQETMSRCYSKFGDLDERDPWPYVSSVARHAAVDSLRRNSRLVPTDELPEPAGSGVGDATYDAVLVKERQRQVREALGRLRPADRQLLEEHELAGVGYADLAAQRDMTQNNVRQRIFRAKLRLAAELRRAGTTLGLVPVSVQVRIARLTRKVNDLAASAGPAGASALSIAAVAGVATVGALLTTPAAPDGTPWALAEPVPAVERVAYRTRPAAPERVARPGAAVAQKVTVRPAQTRPDGPSGQEPPLPIFDHWHGDPINKPQEPTGFSIPIGDGRVWVEMGWVPGSGVLCAAGALDCPAEQRPEQGSQ